MTANQEAASRKSAEIVQASNGQVLEANNRASLGGESRDTPLSLHGSDAKMEGKDIEASSISTPQLSSQQTNASTILKGKKLAVVFFAMMLSLLLIALDQTILATALPRIASDFSAFSLQGWVSSAFVLTQTPFLLVFGQVLRLFKAKYILLMAIVVFEVGSLICGVAPDVYVLIVGRAISGVGAAGMFVSMIQIISQVTLLKDRPRLFGLFGAVFGISSIIGPLIGGAFTDHVTWRWCFYVNLPVGAVSFAACLFLLKPSAPLGSDPNDKSSAWSKLIRLDWTGGILTLGAVTCLVLGLQWGGNEKAWNSAAVIVTLVLSGVVAIALIFWERFLQDRSLVPLAIFKSISIYAIIAYAFTTRFALLLFTYYIPIFYEAAKGESATKSAILLLPLMLAVVLTVITSGQIVARTGYYWPWLVGAPVFLSVGSGLLYTISESTSNAKIIGFQILVGIGIGGSMQNSLMAMQAEFNETPKLLAQATSMASFGQFLGGTIGLAAGEAAFSTQLKQNLAKFAPNAPLEIVKQAPTNIYTSLNPSEIGPVVQAYVKSLDIVYIIGVPVAGLALVFSFFIKNINIRQAKAEENKAEKEVAVDEEKVNDEKQTTEA